MATPVKYVNPVTLGQGGGSPYFQVVAFNKDKSTVAIKYGVLNVNSRFVAPMTEDGKPLKFGTATTIKGVSAGDYIYLKINGIFKRNDAASIEFVHSTTPPWDIKVPAKPFPSMICLAWIENETGKIFDLRPAWIISVFSFLG